VYNSYFTCSVTADGPRDAACQLKSCYLLHITALVVRSKYHQFSDKVEVEYRLFLAIDMSLCRHKKILFGGCAKFHSLLF